MTHPAVDAAIEGCRRLSEAAGSIGSPDPIEAIKQIDFSPEAIGKYAGDLAKAAAELDKAIEEHEAAQAQHEASAEGDAAAAEREEAAAELAELRAERERLGALVKEVERIGAELDRLVVQASSEIQGIAGSADPAVSIILDSAWYEEILDSRREEAEARVNQAVMSIIDVCRKVHEQVEALRVQLNDMMDALESNAQAGVD